MSVPQAITKNLELFENGILRTLSEHLFYLFSVLLKPLIQKKLKFFHAVWQKALSNILRLDLIWITTTYWVLTIKFIIWILFMLIH